MNTQDELITQAQTIGREHGESAASWVFDGNTTDDTYREILAGIDEGDPAVYDRFREPNLSGEFADDYSIRDLQSELGIEIDWTRDDTQEASELLDECANAFTDAASESFWHEIERMAREHVNSVRAEKLRSAGFPILHAYRPDEGQDYVTWSDRSEYPRESTELYADLSSVGKGEDYYDQTDAVQYSNYRSLREDYPGIFTDTSFSNVNVLGAFVADLSDDLTETLVGLREQYPLYSDEDHSQLEYDASEAAWDEYLAHDVRRDLISQAASEDAMEDAIDALPENSLRERFYELTYDASGYPYLETATSVVFPDYDDTLTQLAAWIWAERCAVFAPTGETLFGEAMS